MTSFRQFEANRRNALRSTGPRSEYGKQQSRRNAVRHGLTAETIISSLEDAEDYKAFEAAIIADYDATTAVERELVLRLASLLWRLRRATAVETNLFEIQAEALREHQQAADAVQAGPSIDSLIYRRTNSPDTMEPKCSPKTPARCTLDVPAPQPNDRAAQIGRQLTHCFMRIVNIDGAVFDRLGQYETSLWRQTVQTLLALQTAKRTIAWLSN